MSTWRPIPKDSFCRFDDTGNMLIAAFDRDNPDDIQVFRVHGGEYGALFEDGRMLTLNEQGWVPFAWRIDDTPTPNDEEFPPMWTDYLTEEPKP